MRFNNIVVLALVVLLTNGARTAGAPDDDEDRYLRNNNDGATMGHRGLSEKVTTENYLDEELDLQANANGYVGATIGHRGWPIESFNEDDLGIRFSKVYFTETPPEEMEHLLPLKMGDFPLTMEMASMMRESQCISVVMNEDCAQCDMLTPELIAKVGGYPLHPSSNPDSPYWELFREVIKVQKQRRSGVDPAKVLPLPKIWAKENPDLEKIAAYVHDELPGTHHDNLIRQLIQEGFTVDRDIIPSYSTVEFLLREVMLAYITTWAVSKVGPYNFATKYYVGRARPEEVAILVAEGELTEEDGVPSDIVDDIKAFELKSQFVFTAYPEGSPTHPSWPAMHSAGSAASLWLPVILNLSEEQICECKLVDWAVSYARTVAGVHFPDDNVAGLKFGQEVIARKLSDHLAHAYGSDPAKVSAKIEQMRFDWSEFKDSDCYKDNFGSN